MPDAEPNPTRSTHEENVLDHTSQHTGDRDYNETYPATQVEPTIVAEQPSAQEHPHASSAPQIKVDTTSRVGRGPVMLVGLLGLALAILIALGLYRRASAESDLKTEASKAAVASVAVTHPVGGASAQDVRLPADTQAYTDTAIYSRTNGYLKKWYADIGTNVRKGQLLAVVETPEVDQQVQQAQADVVTAKANKQLADTTNDRWKALLAKNAVSKQEADQTASDLLVKESALNASEANFRRLQQMQSFEHIYAPFDGVITARNVDVGSLIQAGDSNTPHSELFHLNSVGTLRLYIPVPEVYVRAIHEGEKVKVTSDAYPGEVFVGTIVRNATAIDTMSRTLKVEVDVQNSEPPVAAGSVCVCKFADSLLRVIHDIAVEHGSVSCGRAARWCGAERSSAPGARHHRP